MTRFDLIESLGDRLAEVDVMRGSLLPDDPNRREFDELRAQLDQSQRQLAVSAFNEDTPEFQAAARKVQEVDSQVHESIKNLYNLNRTLDAIRALVDAAASLTVLALPIATL